MIYNYYNTTYYSIYNMIRNNDNLLLNHISIILNYYTIINIENDDMIYYILNDNFAKLYICNKSLYHIIQKYILKIFIKYNILYYDNNISIITKFKYLLSNDNKYKLSIKNLNIAKKNQKNQKNQNKLYKVYNVYKCKCIKCRNIVSYFNPLFFNFEENPKCLNRYNQYNKVIRSNLLKNVNKNIFRLKKPIFIYTPNII